MATVWPGSTPFRGAQDRQCPEMATQPTAFPWMKPAAEPKRYCIFNALPASVPPPPTSTPFGAPRSAPKGPEATAPKPRASRDNSSGPGGPQTRRATSGPRATKGPQRARASRVPDSDVDAEDTSTKGSLDDFIVSDEDDSCDGAYASNGNRKRKKRDRGEGDSDDTDANKSSRPTTDDERFQERLDETLQEEIRKAARDFRPGSKPAFTSGYAPGGDGGPRRNADRKGRARFEGCFDGCHDDADGNGGDGENDEGALRKALKMLGCTESSGKEELKYRLRMLRLAVHPDKANAGHSKPAKYSMAEVNAATELLRMRGFL